jgi:hypothetical protein
VGDWWFYADGVGATSSRFSTTKAPKVGVADCAATGVAAAPRRFDMRTRDGLFEQFSLDGRPSLLGLLRGWPSAGQSGRFTPMAA